MEDILLEEIRKAERLLPSHRNASLCHHCYFWPFVSQGEGIAERKMELDFSSVWQLNSWRKLFCSFWAQQRSCLGRQQVPTTLQIFSSQLAIINFKTFSPRNFPMRESREQCTLWEDKARLWGWTGQLKSQMQTKNGWKMKDVQASKPP